jgi:hypothetical protein
MAQRWYEGRMEADWRGRPAKVAQEIFAAVGLVGDFWRME